MSKHLEEILAFKHRKFRENPLNHQPDIHTRADSTYKETFADSINNRSKSKALNEKINFKLEELSTRCKFPPIPRGQLKEQFIKKNSIQLSLNDPSYSTCMGSKVVAKHNLNKTLDTSKRYKKGKSKPKLKFKFDMRSHSSALAENDLEFMQTNIDRPRVSPLQDTLPGVLESNSKIKHNQRSVQRYHHWAGMKIPIGKPNLFNHCRDKMNMWDEKRDGIFHQL